MSRKRPVTAAALQAPKIPTKTWRTTANNDFPNGHELDSLTSDDPLSFRDLARILEPMLQINRPIWKKDIDRMREVVLFYQMDMLANPPKLLRSVQLDYRELNLSSGMSKKIFCPTVYIGDRPIPAVEIHKVLGRSYIHFAEDVALLLERFGRSEENHIETPEVVTSAVHIKLHDCVPRTKKTSISNVCDAPSQQSDDAEWELPARAKKRKPSSVKLARKSGDAQIKDSAAVKPRAKTSADKPPKFAEPIGPLPSGLFEISSATAPQTVHERAIVYREIAARELGMGVNDDLPVLSHNQCTNVNKVYRDVCGLEDKEQVPREARFGGRSLRVWQKFNDMVAALKKNKSKGIPAAYVDRCLAKLSDEEAIAIMQSCEEEMSVDPLEVAYRIQDEKRISTIRKHRASKAKPIVRATGTAFELNGLDWEVNVTGPSDSSEYAH